MQKRTKSLLEELESIGNNRDMNHVIESRANNIITSAINLIELMNRHYSQEKAKYWIPLVMANEQGRAQA